MTKYIIIVSGPQGSGKTTQAERISKRYGMPLFEAGVQLRDFAEGDTPEALEVREALNRGELVPNHYVDNLFLKFVQGAAQQIGVITEGFPRTVVQFEGIVEKVATELSASIIGVSIALDKATAIARIAKRTETENGVPQKRDDDTPEAIKQRFQIYEQETIPVLDQVRTNHKLIEIDGSPTADEVSASIFAALDPILHGH